MPHVARRLHAGSAIQRVDAQAGIIREHDDRVVAVSRSSLRIRTDGILGGSADETAARGTVCTDLREPSRRDSFRQRMRLDQRVLRERTAVFRGIGDEPRLLHGEDADPGTLRDLPDLSQLVSVSCRKNDDHFNILFSASEIHQFRGGFGPGNWKK